MQNSEEELERDLHDAFLSWVQARSEGQESGSKANYPMQNADLEGDLQKQSSVYPNGLDL